ncbi:hypothetical protein ABFS83_03G048200 [Erythranthe nasuta]
MAASIASLNSTTFRSLRREPTPRNLILSPISVFLPFRTIRFRAITTRSDGGSAGVTGYGPELLRKPVALPPAADDYEDPVEEYSGDEKGGDGNTWQDWEDRILEDTVPLVGFVRMILHSGKYESGDRLSPEHEKTIIERLLVYHPECEEKIGSGVDYVTIGYHPNFECSRCLFIVHKDGELVDFSYWKCIKGFIRKHYPLYADNFILRHFRRHRISYWK